jgi:hypothetical protein
MTPVTATVSTEVVTTDTEAQKIATVSKVTKPDHIISYTFTANITVRSKMVISFFSHIFFHPRFNRPIVYIICSLSTFLFYILFYFLHASQLEIV